MNLDEAVKVFGSKAAVAHALHIRPQSVQGWGGIVPPDQRPRLIVLSVGKLKGSPTDLQRWAEVIDTMTRATAFSVQDRRV
jgi:hypothetical protein